MLLSREDCLPLLCCPGGQHQLCMADGTTLKSNGSNPPKSYPVINGFPILVDFETSVLDEAETIRSSARSVRPRPQYKGIKAKLKRLLSPQKSSTKKNIDALIRLLHANENPVRLLVLGGGTIGQGMEPVYDDPAIGVIGFDIYATPFVQFVADAHRIPMRDESCDAVIVQAVLEHVLQPADVVAEIWRVLRPDGLVYAETPFMQQVHEAAYDFTRFTESGHRYLFRRFDGISSGASGGPGLQFMWSADYLARSLFRSRTAGKIAKLLFFWTQYLDNFIPPDFAVDGASGVYLMGRKSKTAMGPKSIIAHYQGAQK
jgi:SAM-dependent methyltransferase